MAKCFACGRDLVTAGPVTSDLPADYKFDPYTGAPLSPPHFFDALEIRFIGGWNMYLDIPTASHGVSLIVCGTCVEDTRQALPWFNHFLEAVDGDADGIVQPYYEVKENSM